MRPAPPRAPISRAHRGAFRDASLYSSQSTASPGHMLKKTSNKAGRCGRFRCERCARGTAVHEAQGDVRLGTQLQTGCPFARIRPRVCTFGHPAHIWVPHRTTQATLLHVWAPRTRPGTQTYANRSRCVRLGTQPETRCRIVHASSPVCTRGHPVLDRMPKRTTHARS